MLCVLVKTVSLCDWRNKLLAVYHLNWLCLWLCILLILCCGPKLASGLVKQYALFSFIDKYIQYTYIFVLYNVYTYIFDGNI